MTSLTHIAGPEVTVCDRYMRQRCSWCGEILLDYDLANVAMVITPEDPHPRPGSWTVGALIRVDGHFSTTVDDTKLPDDFCGAAVWLTPADFGEMQ